MIIIAAILILIWGAGSLYLVAVKTNSIKSVFLKKPSIIVSDFLILPIIGGLIIHSFQSSGKNLSDLLAPATTFVLLVASLTLAAISAIRNKLLSWWTILVGILFHQTLGILFPKRFPKIN